MWTEIKISNYLNMHKSRYKFTKKINKCDVIIKSIITKRTISRKEKRSRWNNNKKSIKRKNKTGERERESIDLFVVDNLEGIGERGGNEVRINLYEN